MKVYLAKMTWKKSDRLFIKAVMSRRGTVSNIILLQTNGNLKQRVQVQIPT